MLVNGEERWADTYGTDKTALAREAQRSKRECCLMTRGMEYNIIRPLTGFIRPLTGFLSPLAWAILRWDPFQRAKP